MWLKTSALPALGDFCENLTAMEIPLAFVPRRSRRTHHRARAESWEHKRLSKALSKILRHEGPSSGVRFYEDGYASVDEVCSKLRWPASWDDVNECVQGSIKRGQPRFELKYDEVIQTWVIRATSKWSTSFGSPCGSPPRTPCRDQRRHIGSFDPGQQWATLSLGSGAPMPPPPERPADLARLPDTQPAVACDATRTRIPCGLEPPVALHMFHVQCLGLLADSRCPVCRAEPHLPCPPRCTALCSICGTNQCELEADHEVNTPDAQHLCGCHLREPDDVRTTALVIAGPEEAPLSVDRMPPSFPPFGPRGAPAKAPPPHRVPPAGRGYADAEEGGQPSESAGTDTIGGRRHCHLGSYQCPACVEAEMSRYSTQNKKGSEPLVGPRARRWTRLHHPHTAGHCARRADSQ